MYSFVLPYNEIRLNTWKRLSTDSNIRIKKGDVAERMKIFDKLVINTAVNLIKAISLWTGVFSSKYLQLSLSSALVFTLFC